MNIILLLILNFYFLKKLVTLKYVFIKNILWKKGNNFVYLIKFKLIIKIKLIDNLYDKYIYRIDNCEI